MSRWKKGDTAPPMRIDCFDGDGRSASFTNATLVQVKVTQGGVTRWTRNVPPSNRQGNRLTVPLQPSDTATPGTYSVKAYVEWDDGTRQHYPPADQYMEMIVTR